MYGKSSWVTSSFLSPSSIMRSVTLRIASSSSSNPRSSRFLRIFALPLVFPNAYSRLRPKRSGSKSLQYRLFLLSPSACTPATCVNTFSPTIGLLAGITIPEYDSTTRLTSFKRLSSILVIALKWSFRIAWTLARGALPARSPSPFIVVWSPLTPLSTAANTLLTARS